MSSIRDAAMGFEAVKISMSQDRNGSGQERYRPAPQYTSE
jgi:hypothetical protein